MLYLVINNAVLPLETHGIIEIYFEEYWDGVILFTVRQFTISFEVFHYSLIMYAQGAKFAVLYFSDSAIFSVSDVCTAPLLLHSTIFWLWSPCTKCYIVKYNTHMHTHMHTHTHTHTYTHRHTQRHTYTHIHTHTSI